MTSFRQKLAAALGAGDVSRAAALMQDEAAAPIRARAARIVELRAQLVELNAEHPEMYAETTRQRQRALEAHDAVLAAMAAQRLVQRDSGLAAFRLQAHNAARRAAEDELAALLAEIEGDAQRLSAPVVHSAWQAGRENGA